MDVHHYTLLRAARTNYLTPTVARCRCTMFYVPRCNLPPTHIYIAFSSSLRHYYDVSTTLPPERAERLVSREKRTFCKEGGKPVTLPVDYHWSGALTICQANPSLIKWKADTGLPSPMSSHSFSVSFVEALPDGSLSVKTSLTRYEKARTNGQIGGVDRGLHPKVLSARVRIGSARLIGQSAGTLLFFGYLSQEMGKVRGN